MDTSGHILTEFDTALADLKNNILAMACQSRRNLEHAIAGLTMRQIELCNKVIADDDEVDQLEIQVDKDCLNIMAKYRPFASDLRFVIGTMKITHNLERVSDHAVSIAKRGRKILKGPEVDEISFIEPPFHQALAMLKKAIQSYTESNLTTAQEVLEMDIELNECHKAATKAFTKRLEQPVDNHKVYLNLVFITRWLERIGDLAINIAEDVIFIESAKDVRHGGELREKNI